MMHYNPSDSISAELYAKLRKAWEMRALESHLDIKPYTDYASAAAAGDPLLGEQLLEQNKAACLIVAGGQGTRLGYHGPKGCLELFPGYSLFRIHCEKILQASQKAGHPLPVAIMTAPENHDATLSFFEEHHYFGLEPTQVVFFTQGEFPLFNEEGNPLPFKGPSGNGSSLYHLYTSGIASDWEKQGIEQVSFVQVDNPLAEPFDSALLGYQAKTHADVTLKAVFREDPKEKVGVIVKEKGKVAVVEYNEIEVTEQEARDPNGKLLHPCANISLFAFSLDFILRLNKENAWEKMPLHVAHKRILQEANQWGYKFEYFIFDVLPFSNTTRVLVYPRHQCFAPIKDLADLESFRRTK